MGIHHAKVCEACERQCPDWADRCPACASLSLVSRFIIAPASAVAPALRARRPAARRPRVAGLEPPRPHGAPAHSSA
jgi:predicted ATP-dependent serine protease